MSRNHSFRQSYPAPGVAFAEPEKVVTIRPVNHPEMSFVTKNGRFIGEADVLPDEVIAVETPSGRRVMFQAQRAGRLQFHMLIKDGREHVAASGVPARCITDFEQGKVKVIRHGIRTDKNRIR